MNKIQRFFNPDEEQEENAIMPNISGLSWETRLKGAGFCLLIAVLLGLGGVIIFFLGGNLTGFAILYTFAVIFGIAATFFLVGPMNQLKKMFDPSRLIATIVFLGAIVMTLVSALVLDIAILVLLFVFIQFIALIFYLITYIPFAKEMAQTCCRRITGV